MTYLSSKKIYPGNWTVALNGWYKNIDANPADGTNDSSKGGPTCVLAVPGYRYFQQRGYVAVTNTSGAGATVTGSIIVPSPYRNDDTRTDITGMVISGNSTNTAYVYRTTISVASGWGDGRVASGIYAATGNVISVGRDSSGPVAASGVGDGVFQANLVSTVSGTQSAEIFFAAGSAAYSTDPFITATGAAGTVPGPTTAYYAVTAATTVKVFAKSSGNAAATSGGFYISSGDAAAGRTGYLVVEVCYVQPDVAPGYEDIDAYLIGRTVS